MPQLPSVRNVPRNANIPAVNLQEQYFVSYGGNDQPNRLLPQERNVLSDAKTQGRNLWGDVLRWARLGLCRYWRDCDDVFSLRSELLLPRRRQRGFPRRFCESAIFCAFDCGDGAVGVEEGHLHTVPDRHNIVLRPQERSVRQEQERLFLPSQVVKPHKDSGLRARLVELLRLVWRPYTVQREMCHIPLPFGAPPETGTEVAYTAGLPSNELEMSPPWV
jgi:hypothetical protein